MASIRAPGIFHPHRRRYSGRSSTSTTCPRNHIPCKCSSSRWKRGIGLRLPGLQIAKDGLFVTDRYGQKKAHPAERVAKDAAVICARLFRELSLSSDYLDEPRIPRVGGERS